MRVLSVICYVVYIFMKALELHNFSLLQLRLGSKKLILPSLLRLQGLTETMNKLKSSAALQTEGVKNENQSNIFIDCKIVSHFQIYSYLIYYISKLLKIIFLFKFRSKKIPFIVFCFFFKEIIYVFKSELSLKMRIKSCFIILF